jgi:hypothetical protein
MPFVISTILFALAVVLVVLTRMRLAKPDAPVAGRLDIPTKLVNAHTAVGALALVLWGPTSSSVSTGSSGPSAWRCGG